MTDVSRSVSISKKFSSVNDGSTKHIYDGVFSSPQPSRPKLNGSMLPTRIEDYAEIFACSLSSASAIASLGSSIPILDLPAVDRSRGVISGADYAGVFGGDGRVDRIGLSYEELLRESKKAGREFSLPRVPVQPSSTLSKTQEFPVNSGVRRTSTIGRKKSSRSQEFPLNAGKNQAPTNYGNNTASIAPGTGPPSKSQEFSLNRESNQIPTSKHNVQTSTPLERGSSKSQESPHNMINNQMPTTGTENRHTSTGPATQPSNSLARVPSKSQEFPLNMINNQIPKATDKDQTSTTPETESLKSQEFLQSTQSNQISKSIDNGHVSASLPTQPLRSREFPWSTGNNQMPASTDNEQVSQSQDFVANAGNNQETTSVTSDQPLDTSQNFNVSYNKINHLNTDDMIHVAELNAVSGYTCLINEAAAPSKKINLENMSSSDAGVNVDADKKKKQVKHTRAISDLSSNSQASEHASVLRRGFSGPLDVPNLQDLHSFGSNGSLKRFSSQKFKGTPNKQRARFEGDFSQPLLQEELDVNSEAAISAEAMKRAIEEAEVQIRLAKEMLEGNFKMSFKDLLNARDRSVDGSNEVNGLGRLKKVKFGSANSSADKVKRSPPREYVQHKAPRDGKIGKAADKLTEKKQEDYVRSDDAIEKAVSSGSSIFRPTAEEVSWYTEQREPVNQTEMEMANGKYVQKEPNPSHESTRQETGGGEWDAAKQLSQLFSGVKNKLVSFMSKQPETGRKVQQMDFPSASRYPDQSTESTPSMVEDVDAYKANIDREQIPSVEVQVTQPVATSQEGIEREYDPYHGGSGMKTRDIKTSRMNIAFATEHEKVVERVVQSPDAEKLNDDEPSGSFEPEPGMNKSEVQGLGINGQQEKLNYLYAENHNDITSDPTKPETEADTSPMQEHKMNVEGHGHENMAAGVNDEHIQGEVHDVSMLKSVDMANVDHEKGQMDTTRLEHNERPEPACSLGVLDDGELTSWDSSDESAEEIESEEMFEKKADDSFHSTDGRPGLEAAVADDSFHSIDERPGLEADVADGSFHSIDESPGLEASVDVVECKFEERDIDAEDDKACEGEERETVVADDKAYEGEEIELAVVNVATCKADGQEIAPDSQNEGDVDILEERVPTEVLSEIIRDDVDACLGKENEKMEAEERPSEAVASPSEVFNNSIKYSEHLLAASEGVSKLANFSFFSRKEETSEQVDQSSEEGYPAEVSRVDTEAVIELNASNVEAAHDANQISSAQVVDEFIQEEMMPASVLADGSIDMDKTDQEVKDVSAAPSVNFQVLPCVTEQKPEPRPDDDDKAKWVSTDDGLENLGSEVESESELGSDILEADAKDYHCDEATTGKEEGKYDIIEDESVADIVVMGAGVDSNEFDVAMGEEGEKNNTVEGAFETGTGTGAGGADDDNNQHDISVDKEEPKLEASPPKRRRWFQNREEADSSKEPSILVREEMLAEIDQKQKQTEGSRLHDFVEIHVDNSVDKTGVSGAVLFDEGKNNNAEATHRRRRWFDNSQETVVPQKPNLFDGNGTSKETDQVITDESETREHIQNDVTNADSERKEPTNVREGDVPSAEGVSKHDMKAAHRRKRWFVNEEKIRLGKKATILEVGSEATVEVDDESETRETSAKSKGSSETLTPMDTCRKADPEDIRQQRDPRETSSWERQKEKEEKERIAVERVIREARERAFADARERAEKAAAEKAAAEKANTGARVKAAAHGRQGGGSTSSAETSYKSIYEKASAEAKLRAERAAVERATAEARERALQKAMSENAANMDHKHQNSIPAGGSSRASASSDKSSGTINESPQRRKARLERNKRTMERAAKALEEKSMRDVLVQREQAERNKFADALDMEVRRWCSGKEGNLRALLSTLQYVLGPDSGWQPTPLTELVSATAVRKAYKRAALCVHPDKLQQRGATIQQKYICEKVFDLLKEAWHKFNPDDR